MLVPIFWLLIGVPLIRDGSADLVQQNPSVGSPDQRYPRDCYEAALRATESQIYLIQVESYGQQPFLVTCDNGYGGGWTIIQRRLNGQIDFYRGWNDYKYGFGDLTGEFWIGLKKLHAITADTMQELLIVMEDFDGEIKTAKYDLFGIGNENEGYALKLLGQFSGTAGDSLTYHKSYKFTTHDKNNGPDPKNCAEKFKGAWWYKSCHESNLNGMYLKGQHNKFGESVSWYRWHGHYYSLKSTKMMIRPKN